MTVRILLADDQPLLRMGFAMVLNSQPDLQVVGEAADGGRAVAAALELRPDVVLTDIRMPGMDGIEACRELVTVLPSCRVVILTTFGLDEYVFAALRAGASGFLLKDCPPEELLAGIRAVADGDAVMAPRITRRLLDTVVHHLPEAAAPVHQDLARLTDREREVLESVAGGLANAEIAGKLQVSEATVKTHIGRILHKLELRDRVQMVIFAYDTGIVRPS
ncbi:response regulator [Labedaea rhizosphaerae]|uniref:LuxR family two component transcriptional regulator n=1 Tax=Labedaea rhizosphaerae TaxID=598644 RepID=A0A4R6SG45_LABRH|nr:response regulator transcription factor [Labedaea rhizosphaerae]TDQ00655.1 LuxR family two component transcriptional regulator [Labedaea rhizosphaerae]